MNAALPWCARALLLTAGLGTRLRPLTDVRAKAAVPVDGGRWLAASSAGSPRQGIRDLVLNLHHRAESIAAVIGDGGDLGVRVRYSWEQPVLGSAGGPRHALPLLIDGEPRTDVPDRQRRHAHRLSIWPATRSATGASGAAGDDGADRQPGPAEVRRRAVVGDGSVTGFTRAPARLERPSFHFIGVQVGGGEAFAALEDGVAGGIGQLRSTRA